MSDPLVSERGRETRVSDRREGRGEKAVLCECARAFERECASKKRGGREVVCVRERVCAFEHECANAVQVRAFASAFACTRACMHTHACVRVYCSNGLASGLRIWG